MKKQTLKKNRFVKRSKNRDKNVSSNKTKKKKIIRGKRSDGKRRVFSNKHSGKIQNVNEIKTSKKLRYKKQNNNNDDKTLKKLRYKTKEKTRKKKKYKGGKKRTLKKRRITGGSLSLDDFKKHFIGNIDYDELIYKYFVYHRGVIIKKLGQIATGIKDDNDNLYYKSLQVFILLTSLIQHGEFCLPADVASKGGGPLFGKERETEKLLEGKVASYFGKPVDMDKAKTILQDIYGPRGYKEQYNITKRGSAETKSAVIYNNLQSSLRGYLLRKEYKDIILDILYQKIVTEDDKCADKLTAQVQLESVLSGRKEDPNEFFTGAVDALGMTDQNNVTKLAEVLYTKYLSYLADLPEPTAAAVKPVKSAAAADEIKEKSKQLLIGMIPKYFGEPMITASQAQHIFLFLFSDDANYNQLYSLCERQDTITREDKASAMYKWCCEHRLREILLIDEYSKIIWKKLFQKILDVEKPSSIEVAEAMLNSVLTHRNLKREQFYNNVYKGWEQTNDSHENGSFNRLTEVLYKQYTEYKTESDSELPKEVQILVGEGYEIDKARIALNDANNDVDMARALLDSLAEVEEPPPASPFVVKAMNNRADKKETRREGVGFWNPAAQCYFVTIIQCLTNIKAFADAIQVAAVAAVAVAATAKLQAKNELVYGFVVDSEPKIVGLDDVVFAQAGEWGGFPLYRAFGNDYALFRHVASSEWMFTPTYSALTEKQMNDLSTARRKTDDGAVPLGQKDWQCRDDEGWVEQGITLRAATAEQHTGAEKEAGPHDAPAEADTSVQTQFIYYLDQIIKQKRNKENPPIGFYQFSGTHRSPLDEIKDKIRKIGQSTDREYNLDDAKIFGVVGGQQDATEFFIFLLDCISGLTQSGSAHKYREAPLDKLYQFDIKTTKQCVDKPENANEKTEENQAVRLAVPNYADNTVQGLLDNYIKETLTTRDDYTSLGPGTFGKECGATIKENDDFANLSEIFIITLNRFRSIYDAESIANVNKLYHARYAGEDTPGGEKIFNALVHFNGVIASVLTALHNKENVPKAPEGSGAVKITNPVRMENEIIIDDKGVKKKYKLIAVCYQTGVDNAGHYYCDFLNSRVVNGATEEFWLRYNDTDVYTVEPPNDDQYNQKTNYMLFYKSVDDSADSAANIVEIEGPVAVGPLKDPPLHLHGHYEWWDKESQTNPSILKKQMEDPTFSGTNISRVPDMTNVIKGYGAWEAADRSGMVPYTTDLGWRLGIFPAKQSDYKLFVVEIVLYFNKETKQFTIHSERASKSWYISESKPKYNGRDTLTSIHTLGEKDSGLTVKFTTNGEQTYEMYLDVYNPLHAGESLDEEDKQNLLKFVKLIIRDYGIPVAPVVATKPVVAPVVAPVVKPEVKPVLTEEDKKNLNKALVDAAKVGDADAVIKCLETVGTDVNAADESGRTALYSAAWMGDVGCMKALVDRGAVIDKANNEGVTPLMAATDNAHKEAVEWLLKNKADWTLTDNNGKTASDKADAELVVLNRAHHDIPPQSKLDELYDKYPVLKKREVDKIKREETEQKVLTDEAAAAAKKMSDDTREQLEKIDKQRMHDEVMKEIIDEAEAHGHAEEDIEGMLAELASTAHTTDQLSESNIDKLIDELQNTKQVSSIRLGPAIEEMNGDQLVRFITLVFTTMGGASKGGGPVASFDAGTPNPDDKLTALETGRVEADSVKINLANIDSNFFKENGITLSETMRRVDKIAGALRKKLIDGKFIWITDKTFCGNFVDFYDLEQELVDKVTKVTKQKYLRMLISHGCIPYAFVVTNFSKFIQESKYEIERVCKLLDEENFEEGCGLKLLGDDYTLLQIVDDGTLVVSSGDFEEHTPPSEPVASAAPLPPLLRKDTQVVSITTSVANVEDIDTVKKRDDGDFVNAIDRIFKFQTLENEKKELTQELDALQVIMGSAEKKFKEGVAEAKDEVKAAKEAAERAQTQTRDAQTDAERTVAEAAVVEAHTRAAAAEAAQKAAEKRVQEVEEEAARQLKAEVAKTAAMLQMSLRAAKAAQDEVKAAKEEAEIAQTDAERKLAEAAVAEAQRRAADAEAAQKAADERVREVREEAAQQLAEEVAEAKAQAAREVTAAKEEVNAAETLARDAKTDADRKLAEAVAVEAQTRAAAAEAAQKAAEERVREVRGVREAAAQQLAEEVAEAKAQAAIEVQAAKEEAERAHTQARDAQTETERKRWQLRSVAAEAAQVTAEKRVREVSVKAAAQQAEQQRLAARRRVWLADDAKAALIAAAEEEMTKLTAALELVTKELDASKVSEIGNSQKLEQTKEEFIAKFAAYFQDLYEKELPDTTFKKLQLFIMGEEVQEIGAYLDGA